MAPSFAPWSGGGDTASAAPHTGLYEVVRNLTAAKSKALYLADFACDLCNTPGCQTALVQALHKVHTGQIKRSGIWPPITQGIKREAGSSDLRK